MGEFVAMAKDERAAPAAGFTRRELLGVGVATLALSACEPAVLKPPVRAASSRPTLQLSNGGTVLEFAAGPDAAMRLASLRNARTGFEWASPGQAFAPMLASAEQPAPVWQPARLRSSSAEDLSLSARAGELEAQLEVRAFADTAAFGWRQTYRNTGAEPAANVTGLAALDLELNVALERLLVHAVRRSGDYTREALPLRDRVRVAGGQWNAPDYAGLLIIEAVGRSEYLVLGVQQERGWELTLERTDGRVRLRVTEGAMERSLSAGVSLSACPLFVATSQGTLDDAINVALRHLATRLMPAPLARAPWVSYNIWSTDGRDVEKNILDEIPFAAQLGVDLFYLDASWYRGSSTRGTGDWGKGLGSYREDLGKFPHGLRHLSDRVHAAGMKFGLWVGPNIVDAALVPREIPVEWLAMVDGKPAELTIPTWQDKCLQVCLGSQGYAAHLQENLARIVEEFALDWLKWDNSGIPALPARCNRGDHGHLPNDGSAAALANEYAIFAHLRAKFPQLALEQCGYGSRLDYGLATDIRANWCSDTCYPAAKLRSNSLVCATVYPSACNAAWIVREDTELFEATTTAVRDAGIRSRMIGLFGVGTLNGQMSQRASLYPPALIERLAENIRLYKRFRHLLYEQVSFPYAPYGTDPHGWQAVQFTDAAATESVVLCFRGASTQAVTTLVLSRLDPARAYSVALVDAGTTSIVGGQNLMEVGIYLELPEAGASEIIVLSAAPRST
jgi:hypothetical protein